MSINKNISVWRGNSPPPTEYHLWVDNGIIKQYIDKEWKPIKFNINLNNPQDNKYYLLQNGNWVEFPMDSIFKTSSSGQLIINTTDKAIEGSSLPISSGGVYSIIGDINSILDLI